MLLAGSAGFSYFLPAITRVRAEQHKADQDDRGSSLAEVFHERRSTIGALADAKTAPLSQGTLLVWRALFTVRSSITRADPWYLALKEEGYGRPQDGQWIGRVLLLDGSGGQSVRASGADPRSSERRFQRVKARRRGLIGRRTAAVTAACPSPEIAHHIELNVGPTASSRRKSEPPQRLVVLPGKVCDGPTVGRTS